MRHILGGTLALVLAAALPSCSENFGMPPDPGAGLAIGLEGFAGPLSVNATVLLRAGGDQLFLGTERGAYRLARSGSSWRWQPGPEEAGAQRVLLLAGRGDIWCIVQGAFQVLLVSQDGGRVFEQVLPPIIGTGVTAVEVLPPSPAHVSGAILATVGLVPWIFDLGVGAWASADIPATPTFYGPFVGDTSGRVAAAVQSAGGWELWSSDDGGATFASTSVLPEGPVYDVALLEGDIAYLTPARLVAAGSELLAADTGWGSFTGGDLESAGGVVDVFAHASAIPNSILYGDWPGGLMSIAAPQPLALGLGVAATSAGGIAGTPNGDILELVNGAWTTTDFAGGMPEIQVVTHDPREPGYLYYAEGRGAQVFRGPAAGPVESLGFFLGFPGAQSVRALLADTNSAQGVFTGAFGAYYLATQGGNWEQRNDGQDTYDCSNLGAPVNIQTLAADPSLPGRVWLGAINGDGPYLSDDGGQRWLREHQGLGPLSDCVVEAGLIGVSQVHAFAFVSGETWMATFRGGVWQWKDGLWEQRNRGLPDVMGDVVDACCYDPLERIVDVRDVVVLSDGSLLAATGFGIYRDDGRAGNWLLSSEGLSNFDVYHLAPHPDRPDWILAGCDANASVTTWLYLSQDGGTSWQTVNSELLARKVNDLVWSDPAADEATAVLQTTGAWRVVLRP